MILTADGDLLLEADEAERQGDRSAAAAKLREYLARRADDGAVRLRLGRLLSLAERRPPQVLARWNRPSDGADDTTDDRTSWRPPASWLRWGEQGALTSAQIRWERVRRRHRRPDAQSHLRRLPHLAYTTGL